MPKSFEDVNLWKEGYILLKKVYAATGRYPKEEAYGLTSQTRRASNGIIANIAEAHGRYYFADKVRVLYIARGECCETRSHLAVAHGLGYLSGELYTELKQRYQGMEKGINTYLKELRKRKHN